VARLVAVGIEATVDTEFRASPDADTTIDPELP
jgi:hypothetical protein